MVILVTEDVEDTRELMRLLLEHFGHEVETAANGKLALEAVAKRVPDLILMDLRMPVMDGFTAIKLIRETLQATAVPIVAVSAYVRDKAWYDKAIAAGCNDCIGKPVDQEELQRVLAQYA